MTTDLEQRRLAIADALRAVMSEPLPPQQEQRPHRPRRSIAHLLADQVREARTSRALEPATAQPPAPVTMRASLAAAPAPEVRATSGLLPMREALAAQINWEDEDAPAVADAPADVPATAADPAAVSDRLPRREARDEPSEPDEAAAVAAPDEPPSVIDEQPSDPSEDDTSAIPPLETVASMSTAASMALFGHA